MRDTDQLIEICCEEQTQNKCEITVSLSRGPLKGRGVWPLPADWPAPHASLPCVGRSKDLSAFCHRDCPRGKRSNCRKCLVFLPLLRGGEMRVKKSTRKVPRKAIQGPWARRGRGTDSCGRAGPDAFQNCPEASFLASGSRRKPFPAKHGSGHLFLPLTPPSSSPRASTHVSRGCRDRRETASSTHRAGPCPPASPRTPAPGGLSGGPGSSAARGPVRPAGCTP